MKTGVPIRYQHLGHAYLEGGCIGSLCRPISRAVGFSISPAAKNRIIIKTVRDVFDNIDGDLDENSTIPFIERKTSQYLLRNLDDEGYHLSTYRHNLYQEMFNATMHRLRARMMATNATHAVAARPPRAVSPPPTDPENTFFYPGVMQYRNPEAVAPRRRRQAATANDPIDDSALLGEDE